MNFARCNFDKAVSLLTLGLYEHSWALEEDARQSSGREWRDIVACSHSQHNRLPMGDWSPSCRWCLVYRYEHGIWSTRLLSLGKRKGIDTVGGIGNDTLTQRG